MSLFKHFLHKAADLLYPPRCLICEDFVMEHNNLCINCWPQLNFAGEHLCVKCGMSLSFSDTDLICAGCITTPPPFSMAHYIVDYSGVGRELVHKLKYNDNTRISHFIAKQMYIHAKQILYDASLIVPVPLHPKKLAKRRFNQATLIARHLSKLSNISLGLRCIDRTVNTTQQFTKTINQRKHNVKNAFHVSSYDSHKISNKIIVLIDDVMTTGATIESCSKALLKSGAQEVRALTFARTTRIK